MDQQRSGPQNLPLVCSVTTIVQFSKICRKGYSAVAFQCGQLRLKDNQQMQRKLGFGMLSLGESESDQDTGNSPKFIELSLFKYSEPIELKETVSYILQNFEQTQLKDKYMGLMHMRFGDQILQASYNDESLFKELLNYVNRIVYRFFSVEELHGRAAIMQCRSLKTELASKGYRLFELNGLVYLYGLSRWKQDIDDIKASIMNESIHDLKFFHYKKSLNLEEKIIYEAIFEHTRDFASIIESNPAQVVTIEPKLFKPQKRNRWGLSFIVRAKKRIQFKGLCRTIYDTIRSYSHATLLTSKPRTATLFATSKKFTVKYHASRAQLQHLIFVIYERAKIDIMQLEETIRELESQGGFKVEGYRYLENQLDMGLKSAKFELESLGCRTELSPRDSPYAINAYIKWKERGSAGILRSLLEMANVHTKQTESNKSTSSNEEEEEEDEEQCCSYISNTPSDTEPTQIEEQPEQKLFQEPLLFEVSAQKPITMTVDGRTYSRITIESSQAFLEQYNSIVQKEVPIAITSFPFKILTFSRCDTYNEYVELVPIEEAYKSCDYFVEGFVKINSFATGNKCFSVRPTYLLELKQQLEPKKKKSSKP